MKPVKRGQPLSVPSSKGRQTKTEKKPAFVKSAVLKTQKEKNSFKEQVLLKDNNGPKLPQIKAATNLKQYKILIREVKQAMEDHSVNSQVYDTTARNLVKLCRQRGVSPAFCKQVISEICEVENISSDFDLNTLNTYIRQSEPWVSEPGEHRLLKEVLALCDPDWELQQNVQIGKAVLFNYYSKLQMIAVWKHFQLLTPENNKVVIELPRANSIRLNDNDPKWCFYSDVLENLSTGELEIKGGACSVKEYPKRWQGNDHYKVVYAGKNLITNEAPYFPNETGDITEFIESNFHNQTQPFLKVGPYKCGGKWEFSQPFETLEEAKDVVDYALPYILEPLKQLGETIKTSKPVDYYEPETNESMENSKEINQLISTTLPSTLQELRILVEEQKQINQSKNKTPTNSPKTDSMEKSTEKASNGTPTNTPKTDSMEKSTEKASNITLTMLNHLNRGYTIDQLYLANTYERTWSQNKLQETAKPIGYPKKSVRQEEMKIDERTSYLNFPRNNSLYKKWQDRLKNKPFLTEKEFRDLFEESPYDWFDCFYVIFMDHDGMIIYDTLNQCYLVIYWTSFHPNPKRPEQPKQPTCKKPLGRKKNSDFDDSDFGGSNPGLVNNPICTNPVEKQPGTEKILEKTEVHQPESVYTAPKWPEKWPEVWVTKTKLNWPTIHRYPNQEKPKKPTVSALPQKEKQIAEKSKPEILLTENLQTQQNGKPTTFVNENKTQTHSKLKNQKPMISEKKSVFKNETQTEKAGQTKLATELGLVKAQTDTTTGTSNEKLATYPYSKLPVASLSFSKGAKCEDLMKLINLDCFLECLLSYGMAVNKATHGYLFVCVGFAFGFICIVLVKESLMHFYKCIQSKKLTFFSVVASGVLITCIIVSPTFLLSAGGILVCGFVFKEPLQHLAKFSNVETCQMETQQKLKRHQEKQALIKAVNKKRLINDAYWNSFCNAAGYEPEYQLCFNAEIS